jgi:hypothetical protein
MKHKKHEDIMLRYLTGVVITFVIVLINEILGRYTYYHYFYILPIILLVLYWLERRSIK